MSDFQVWLENVKQAAYMAFIQGDRWKLYFKGLGVTMQIAVYAAIIGMVIGTIIAFMKLSTRKNGKPSIWSYLATAYMDVIRGTPSVLQLLIMWFIIFASCKNSMLVAALAFGINSGAYVAEIVRAGILAVDKGQTEAGRALGLSKFQTMIYIVIPQAIKNVLPALVNEMITLLKETSICGYIGLNELTRGGDIIRGNTFEALLPLLAVAAIYLIIVMFFTWVMGKLERRLRESDNR